MKRLYMRLTRRLVCRQAVALMTDYLEGQLNPRDAKRLERHLARCDVCSEYLAQLRVTIDAPGNSRPVWQFDTISAGEQVTVHQTDEYPSAVVLDVVPGVDVPDAYPPCGALRGQPCRPAS